MASNAQPNSPLSPPTDQQEWSAEDDARVLAMLDDGTKASIATMFMGREHQDVITMDQLMEMMAEIQVAYDPDMISKIVPEDSWDNLTLTQCNVIIGRFIEMAQRHVAEQAKAESAVLVTQAAAPIVYLNTVQYLIHLLPCSTKEDGVEYRWTKVKLDIRPKTILMVSVAAMMVVAAVALMTVVIALNESVTRNQLQASVESHGRYAELVSTSLLDAGVKSVSATFLQESSRAVARVVDGFLIARRRIVMDRMQASLTAFRDTFAVHVDSLWLREEELLRQRAHSLRAIFSAQGTVDAVRNIVSEWSPHTGAVVFQGNLRVLHSSLPCVAAGSLLARVGCANASLNGAVVTGVTEEFCGTAYVFTSAPIPRLGTSVCLLIPVDAVNEKIAANVDETVTTFNQLSPDSTVETEVAVVRNDRVQSLGGRKSLAVLCARGGSCAETIELYERAMLASTPGIAIVVGYDQKYWLSSFVSVTVRGAKYLLGLKENAAEDLAEYYHSLLRQPPVTNGTDPAIVFAVGNRLEQVELLPVNTTTPTSSQNQYFGFALHGRSGVLFASLSDATSIMAGYAPAPAAEMAVGLQLPAAGVSHVSLSLLLRVLQAQSASLPLDREILVMTQSAAGDIEHLIPPRTPCGTRCRRHTAALRGFEHKDSGTMLARDHNGREVSAWYGYYAQVPPIVIVVQVLDDRSETLEARYIAIGTGCAIILAVQLVILLLTRRVLDRIENDYNKYKRHIEDEKHQFSELVKDVMPPYIAERIMKGSRLIAETHPQLTFFFSDIVGSTETSKTLTNKQLVRMLGYTFMLEDEIASHFGVHKIKTIGDAYFAVVGLEDSTGGAATGKDHQVYRMVSFACITQQLFGPTYAHFPERTECFKISANGQDMGPMKMVRMRMGIHTGPAVAGVVDVGRAPHFDCFGPSVNLASRMESTSTAGRVQISGPTMEILSKLDKEGLFEFEPPRKTLVKGYGTMVTYLIKSTNLHVPEELISKMHIERAKRRQYFAADARAKTPGGNTTATKRDSSTPSRSDKGSEKHTTPRRPVDQPQTNANDSPADEEDDQDEGLASLLPGMLPVGQPAPPSGPVTAATTKRESRPQRERESAAAPPLPPPPPPVELPVFGGLNVALPPPPPPNF